jgi:two-component sensor histidine kinase
VDLNWSVEPSEGGETRLMLTWREGGGPSVAPPETEGVGRDTFERQLKSEIGAEATLNFAPDGVEASIALALPGNTVVQER